MEVKYEGSKFVHEMLDEINDMLIEIDECFSINDINTAIKKTNACMLLIKGYKECIR